LQKRLEIEAKDFLEYAYRKAVLRLKDYTYFKKDKLTFLDNNNETMKIPGYVARSRKNYRFNHKTQKLEKKCIQCEKYFEVELYKEGKFADIHDEDQIHFCSEISGYAVRCKKCNHEKELEDSEKLKREKDLSSKGGYSFNIKISDQNIKYIRMLAAVESVTEEDFANNCLDVIRKNNKLEYKYDKKLE